MQRFKPVMS